jgi:lipid-A-disaccharide synthase
MVMSYRLGAITYAIVSRIVKTQHFALPNILAGRELVPELMQDAATPEALAEAVLKLFDPGMREKLVDEFDTIHRQLRLDSGSEACDAILNLCCMEHGSGDASVSP